MCRTSKEIDEAIEDKLLIKVFPLKCREICHKETTSYVQTIRHLLKEILNTREFGLEDIVRWINQPVGNRQAGIEYYHFDLEESFARTLRRNGWTCYRKK